MMKLFFSFLSLCLFLSCQHSKTIEKTAPTDLFKHSIVESQHFTIVGGQDTILEGKDGTLLIFPQGSFLTKKGKPVDKDITVELAEALTLKDMILSNLTTTSKGKLLETGGMIYLNATVNGEQLKVNPDRPVYIEIPTYESKPNMMVYQGIRDSMGNMDWIDPKPLSNFLVPLDIFSLDFLPNGFQEEVEKGLPFGTFQEPTDIIVDSLYYFQEVYRQNLIAQLNNLPTLPNESLNTLFLDPEQINSFGVKEEKKEFDTDSLVPKTTYGIDPLKIKAIKTEEFQNTLIATREFQDRLQVMFKICRSDILDIYINNLDRNMWELDSLVAEVLIGDKYQGHFLSFQNERKTKVAGISIHSELLREHYAKKVEEAKNDRQRLFEKLTKARITEEQKIDSLKKGYSQILKQRKRRRMQSYGFKQTQLGWLNIDRGTLEKDWNYQSFELTIKDGDVYDQIFSYVFYPSLNSLYRLNTNDNITFYVGDSGSGKMPIPKYKPAVAAVIAYLGNQSFFALKEFETTTQKKLNTEIQEVTTEELNQKLSAFEMNGPENSIKVDLKYVKQIIPSKKEKQNLIDSYNFLEILRQKSFPSESSFMRFSEIYMIELQVDTCISNIKIKDEIIEVEETVPMN